MGRAHSVASPSSGRRPGPAGSLVLACLEEAAPRLDYSLSLLRKVSIRPITISTELLLGLDKPLWRSAVSRSRPLPCRSLLTVGGAIGGIPIAIGNLPITVLA